MAKKRHHYVPKSYLKAFCDADGKLYVYRKDEPNKKIRLSPDSAGFHKYYYSQPTSDGGMDHDRLEGLFSEYEGKWAGIVHKFRGSENVNGVLDTIYAFVALQRARVPAARDACEKVLAETVKATMRQMNAAGELPPPPKGLEDLLEHVDVAIDPHQSIHAMPYIIRGVGELLDRIGIEVVQNDTDVPFLTSDNPVIWFDPSLPEAKMRPYAVRPDGPVMLMFPVAPDLMIYGDTSRQRQFAQHGVVYSRLDGERAAETMNALVCRFAYDAIFANTAGFCELVSKYAELSPVVGTDSVSVPDGVHLLHQFEWGRRTRKPKWNP